MPNTIILLGSTGQLGSELQKIFCQSQHNLITLTRQDLNLDQPDQIQQLIATHQPQIIINCAAYTAVDLAEKEPELATKVNRDLPQILATIAKDLQSQLIHISTDYVFDGYHHTPYTETDPTNPLGMYGKSKLAGEEAIKATFPQAVIVRTSWLYGQEGKGNFVKTMLRLGKEREEIKVVMDQVGSPTWTGDLAQAITQIPLNLTGIYHYSNSGVASWYDFAVAIFEEAQLLSFPLQVKRIIPITTAEYPTPAKRPAYSVFSTAKISVILGNHPPHWRQSLRKMLLGLRG